jgi:small subunit ribosomal protein S27e
MRKNKFLKVKCPDCENIQIVFSKASTPVFCQVCGGKLSDPTGGKADFKGEIVSELE